MAEQVFSHTQEGLDPGFLALTAPDYGGLVVTVRQAGRDALGQVRQASMHLPPDVARALFAALDRYGFPVAAEDGADAAAATPPGGAAS